MYVPEIVVDGCPVMQERGCIEVQRSRRGLTADIIARLARSRTSSPSGLKFGIQMIRRRPLAALTSVLALSSEVDIQFHLITICLMEV